MGYPIPLICERVCWSDGVPTAEDVIFTFDCILSEVIDEETGEKQPVIHPVIINSFILMALIEYTLIDSHGTV